jgi:hypothetical protein
MPTNAVANVNLPVVVGRGIEGEFHSVQSCVGNAEDSLQVSRNVGHADNTPGQLVVPPAIYMREQLQWRDSRIDYLSKTVETMHRAIDTLNLNVRHLQTSLESQGEAMGRGKKSDFYNGCTPAYEFTMDAMSFASTLDTRFNDQETDRADNMVDNQVQTVNNNKRSPEKQCTGPIPAQCIHQLVNVITTPRRRTMSQHPHDGRNTGLANYNQICYANAMLQLIATIAKGNRVDGCALFNPKEEHQRFPLYYKFASVIRDMISGRITEIVDTHAFMEAFMGIHKEFDGHQRTYCFVV